MTADRLPASATPRTADLHGRARRTLASALALVLLAGTLAVAPTGAGAVAVDPLGDELMRLTNLDRVALGKAPLAIDGTLAAFARDLTFACPTKTSLVLQGRSQDMANRDYFDHSIVGCLKSDGTTMSALDIMDGVLGYRTFRGENIAWNSYPTTTTTYSYGCTIDGTGCKGTTSVPATVAAAQGGFMRSSGHRGNILGGYDRFGCGSAVTPSGRRYFTCLFSLGGSSIAPTPAPTAAPTPSPAPTADPSSAPVVAPTSTPTAPAATVTPAPMPTADVGRPTFVRFTGTTVVRRGYGRTIGVTVADNRALRRLKVWVDGRLLRTWTLSGTRAVRSYYVPSWRLRYGRHTVRWTVWDAAGNSRTYYFRLYVR